MHSLYDDIHSLPTLFSLQDKVMPFLYDDMHSLAILFSLQDKVMPFPVLRTFQK